MPIELEKNYNPQETESKIYKLWEESGFFNPDNLPERHQKPYTIIMPPPNANGHLHAGHALTMTLEDILIRFKRMQGFKTLWVPGADHAGFETQVVYEKKLEKEGRSRFKMDRRQLYDEILAFTLENKEHMENEVRRMGSSCDWSREKFTLDEDIVRQTQQTFKKMFDDGLIYRGPGMVNWCTKHQTSLSNVETEDVEKEDTLYYLTYGPLTVATVRPETMFGDVAIAVHPTDERYRQYVGQMIEVQTPIGSMNLPVIADEAVEKEFGTGALKITPAHDANDFALALRHNLPIKPVIDQFGKLTQETGKYAGLKIAEARKQVAEDLQNLGLIQKTEPYKHAVPTCSKCGSVIEPRILVQWFVKMKPLADQALQAVKAKKISFVSEHFERVFTYWMEHPIDWNISRQIVWGIPIPAKVCPSCDYGAPDLENTLHDCPRCQSPLQQDTDTFDTWFSSGQWPYLVLGYPESADFKAYYPTDVMETGRDLIFKWVPRMVMFGLYRAGAEPFRTVYLHGLVNDAQGKKMSKSKGNVVNPLDLIEKFGTDALRMGLIVGNTPGMDAALSEDKIRGYKNFANKLWNIARFVLMSVPEERGYLSAPLTPEDQALKDEFSTLIKDATKDIEEFRLYMAAEKIYHYVWHAFADKIIEDSKSRLASQDPAMKASAQRTLMDILVASLKLLHPFMPFVTEELWSKLPVPDKRILMIETWPQ
ncbi:MAG TPA: valine--tRNA ligase [Candidatus Paceibacterota bacterium]|nr:valine--tRNA ligase [Candidatus Paceibacterota bacterium]